MNPSQTWLERPLMPPQTASYPSPSMVNYAKFYMAMGIVAFFLLPFAFLLLLVPTRWRFKLAKSLKFLSLRVIKFIQVDPKLVIPGI
ncbi:MAG: hypothetical protein WCA07_05975 [Gloeobacterales cyanobacterium]